jgi:nucleoside phosphorylase
LTPCPLITFAVSAEANPTQHLLRQYRIPARFLLTRIGPEAARNSVTQSLARYRPSFVLTCGFAGALNPDLPPGALAADADPDFPLRSGLSSCGAQFVRFLHSPRILATAREKARSRAESQADVVDMESTIIRQLCHSARVPSATLRVISDAAGEDLPCDFNLFLSRSGGLRYARIALALARSPAQIRALLRFQRQTRTAAQRLAQALLALLTP